MSAEYFAGRLPCFVLRHDPDLTEALQHALAVELALGDEALGLGLAGHQHCEAGLVLVPIEGLLAGRVGRLQVAMDLSFNLITGKAGSPMNSQ